MSFVLVGSLNISSFFVTTIPSKNRVNRRAKTTQFEVIHVRNCTLTIVTHLKAKCRKISRVSNVSHLNCLATIQVRRLSTVYNTHDNSNLLSILAAQQRKPRPPISPSTDSQRILSS